MKFAWIGYFIGTIALLMANFLLLWTHFVAMPPWVGDWGWRWIHWASEPIGFISSVFLPTLFLSLLQTRWVFQHERA